VQFKITKKLFQGCYQHKAVVVCVGAQSLRDREFDKTLSSLRSIDFTSATRPNFLRKDTHIRTKVDADYLISLIEQLSRMKDYDLRVESPWVSIYTNNQADIDALIALNPDNIKYVCSPSANSALSAGNVIMPKMDYDFKVTLSKTTQEHSAFIEWASSNSKVRLTKGCIKDLEKSRSWGGKYFYISGKNNLLMAKMHLGDCIAKIESVIKA
jgi:hypothetical protein